MSEQQPPFVESKTLGYYIKRYWRTGLTLFFVSLMVYRFVLVPLLGI